VLAISTFRVPRALPRAAIQSWEIGSVNPTRLVGECLFVAVVPQPPGHATLREDLSSNLSHRDARSWKNAVVLAGGMFHVLNVKSIVCVLEYEPLNSLGMLR
jgi:hypothetical protein